MGTMTNDDFLSQLLATFRIEAEEHLKAIVAGLLDLEEASNREEQAPFIEATFREAHSLKGAARAVNLTDIEAVCKSLEGVLACLKRGELSLSSTILDTLHRSADTVQAVLDTPEGRHASRVADAVDELTALEEVGQANRSALEEDTASGDQTLTLEEPFGDDVAEADLAENSANVPAEPEPSLDPEVRMEPKPQTGLSAELMDKLRAAFHVEADEHVKAIVAGLLDLEKITTREEQAPFLETIFREAHSLKGAARAVNLTDIETVCSSLEDVFAQLKRGDRDLAPTGFDTLHRTLDSVEVLLTTPEEQHATHVAQALQALKDLDSDEDDRTNDPAHSTEPTRAQEPMVVQPASNGSQPHSNGTVQATNTERPAAVRHRAAAPERTESPVAQPRPTTTETIRVSTAKLDSLLLQAEEMLAVKQGASERFTNLRDILLTLTQWKKEWSKTSPEARKVQRIYESRTEREQQEDGYLPLAAKLVEFLYWSEREIIGLETKLKELTRSAERDEQEVSIMVGNLLEDTKKVMMLPFLSLLDIFPKMVRDLSRSLDKEVDLSMRGSEVEIDKRILEELKDPLIHLLRNCIDHGIETPAERGQKGKPQRGKLNLTISQASASTIEVLVADDGAGIDQAAVKQAAVKAGVLSTQEAEILDEDAVRTLIFQSDVSTSLAVTDLSGRGLGMAIVREKVEKLGGQIAIDSHPGQGTTFRITLPLTLATFRGIFVEAADRTFVVPTANVDRVVRIRKDEIKTIENKETFIMHGRPIVLTQLDATLGLPRRQKQDKGTGYTLALILGAGDRQVAFGVDNVLNEQEVLFKRLGTYLSYVPNVAGATVLGSGAVVPILHAPDLLRSLVATGAGAAKKVLAPSARDDETQSILVAEDSVTSRMLLKGILESAGYQVETAIDGVDALRVLGQQEFNLIVSDVEMPRMNGFDLTASVRSDERYTQLPVVLVTGLESREDQERGINAGANAYIVKGSFDHSNLLDTVQQLI